MSQGIKKKVFISYSRRDKQRIKELVSALEKEGLDVWWDIEIPPGQRYADVIERALESADNVIVAWSKASVKSKWVCREAELGLEREVLLPILLENDVDLPFLFRDRHASNFINWQGDREHFEYLNLIDAIHKDGLDSGFTNKVWDQNHQVKTEKVKPAPTPEPTPITEPQQAPQVEPQQTPQKEIGSKPFIKILGFVGIALLVSLVMLNIDNFISTDDQERKKYPATDYKTPENIVDPEPQAEPSDITPAKPLRAGIGSTFTPRKIEAEPKLILRKRASIYSTGMDAVDYGTLLLVGDRVSNKEIVNNKEGYWFKTKRRHGRNTLYAFDAYLGYYPIYRVNATSGLTVRERATVNSIKVTKLDDGAKVYSISVQREMDSVDNVAGRWHKIHNGEIEGYVFGAYLIEEN